MIAAALLALASASIPTGQWRVTTTVAVAATPSISMPPEPIERFIETKSSELVDLVRTEFLRPDCRLTRYNDNGFVLDARQICNSRETGKTVWTLQGTYSPFRIDVRVNARGQRDGKPFVATKTIVAEFLASGPADPDSSVSHREVEVKGGEWTRIGVDERLKLDIVSDDRCPKGLTCEWAGMARMQLEYVGSRGFARQAELAYPLHPDFAIPAAICAGARRIEVTTVEPQTEKRLSIKPEDYRIHLMLGQCGDRAE